MREINPIAVLAATVAAFVFSAVYYGGVFGGLWMELRGLAGAEIAMTPLQMAAQFGRELIVASVLAYVFGRVGVRDWRGAVGLGLVLWLGLQAMQIAGSVLHEGYSPQLYAIHVGDALGKTLLASLILGSWRRRTSALRSRSA